MESTYLEVLLFNRALTLTACQDVFLQSYNPRTCSLCILAAKKQQHMVFLVGVFVFPHRALRKLSSRGS